MPQTHLQTLPLCAPNGIVARLLTAFSVAFARRQGRQRLARLDTHLLRDIGLEPQEARREFVKPFWQP